MPEDKYEPMRRLENVQRGRRVRITCGDGDDETGAYLDVSLVQCTELVSASCVQDFELEGLWMSLNGRMILVREETHRISCAVELACAFVDFCRKRSKYTSSQLDEGDEPSIVGS